MRRIVGCVFQSLDGVMQAPGGPDEDPSGGFGLGGWQFAFADDVANAVIERQCAPPFALLLGRRTYDIFSSYWPFVEGEEAALGAAFTKAEKFVLTHSDGPLEWENSHRLSGVDAIKALKQGAGPELRIWGSSMLYPLLLDAGLLDSLILLTYPLVLGKGKRVFGEGTPARTFERRDHAFGPGGVSIATLESAGVVRTGASPPAPPNARESERQRKISEETW